MTTGESLFEQYRLEHGMDDDEVRACTWRKAGLIDFADWVLQQKLEQCSVSGWQEFDIQKFIDGKRYVLKMQPYSIIEVMYEAKYLLEIFTELKPKFIPLPDSP